MTAPTPADGSAEQPLLKFSGKQPPLAAFAAAKIAGLQLRTELDPKRTQAAQAAIELLAGCAPHRLTHDGSSITMNTSGHIQVYYNHAYACCRA